MQNLRNLILIKLIFPHCSSTVNNSECKFHFMFLYKCVKLHKSTLHTVYFYVLLFFMKYFFLDLYLHPSNQYGLLIWPIFIIKSIGKFEASYKKKHWFKIWKSRKPLSIFFSLFYFGYFSSFFVLYAFIDKYIHTYRQN